MCRYLKVCYIPFPFAEFLVITIAIISLFCEQNEMEWKKIAWIKEFRKKVCGVKIFYGTSFEKWSENWKLTFKCAQFGFGLEKMRNIILDCIDGIREMLLKVHGIMKILPNVANIHSTYWCVKFGYRLKLHVIDFKSDRRQMLTLFC